MASEQVRIGIDVGGTNTDVVLMSGSTVLASAKGFTTEDVSSGIVDTVTRVLDDWNGDRSAIGSVMIGTTQFVNAFVQRRDLAKVAAIRVSLPRGDGVPPMSGWPRDLRDELAAESYMVGGGSYYTGKDYAPLDEDALIAAAEDARAKKVQSIAITANFAPMRPDIEERAAAVVRKVMPGADITLSSSVGGIGLIDRENATIINASLAVLSRKVISSFVRAFADLRIKAPIFISQNDGTLISTEMASRYPIFTCSAGPTNSIRGAAFLTGLSDAIVVDIGGTTTDIGFLLNDFPRETTIANYIGGVRTNFRMPDVLSLGLGGGSIISTGKNGALAIGPESVGYRLVERGLVFGGDTLTTTDIAVRAGSIALGDPAKVAHLPDATVNAAVDLIHAGIEEGIDKIKTSAAAMPLILVGGGGILVSRPLKGVSEVLRPRHSEVANAVGAAIARVSGRVDKLYDFEALGRDEALRIASRDAADAAIRAGADPATVEIVDIVELPMTHMRTGCVQVRARAAGSLLQTANA
ncbi:hydantoinase/oxoprolinase N-terminal domain-containing protein [Rhizorhabdus histidinilytica]|uniref:hydantoinase/oxoprolinase N-terminal domain-containing protein n=1 Tax=Rhizorhabdus histidinilytica TaxID=439228 RepID=UPI001CC1D6C1|nr:hydantoinase/oxoprolinase family protein [Rhizorhabdus histidinilytica]